MLISVPNVFTVGAVIVASQHNANFSTVYNCVNGNLDNTNIASNAGILDSQLSSINTAGKVSGAALTSLASVPSGAGLLPVANIPVGTTASKIVQLDGSAKLPAVDGSALTGIVPSGIIGSLVSKSFNTEYTAATDGFLLVYDKITGDHTASISIGASSPSTIVAKWGTGNNSFYMFFSLMAVIPKGYHYKYTQDYDGGGNSVIYFISLGS